MSPPGTSSGPALLAGLGVHATETRRRVDGVALHAVEAGPEDGPLVILLHGFPEFWWGWRRQIGPLARAGFRVVAPDQRGYGTSDKPAGLRAYELDLLAADVAGLVEAHGRSRAHLVGHDWGGLVAWWAASRHPDRVDRLAVLNAPHPAVAGRYARRHPSQMLKSWYIAFFQLPRLPEAVLARSDHALLARTLLDSSRPGTFTAADLEAYKASWREPGALTAALNWYRALPRRPALPQPRVSAPTLVLWGVRDRFLEVGLAEASLALCDAGRLVRLDRASHWLHLEEAARVNDELIAFFRPR
ncbi:MAG TPA: alpha/beta hydrolase [Microvirga sp.]|nr:alpha/beta hydrolase [Microvirga sp.]